MRGGRNEGCLGSSGGVDLLLAVVAEEELDDELAALVLWDAVVQDGLEAENLLGVVDQFEEVLLRGLRSQLVDVALGVLLVSEPVVLGDDDRGCQFTAAYAS